MIDPEDFNVGLRDDFLDFLEVTDDLLGPSDEPGFGSGDPDSPPSPLFAPEAPFKEEQPGVRSPFPAPPPLATPPAPFLPAGLHPPPGPQFQRRAVDQFQAVSNQMQQRTHPFQKIFQTRYPFPQTRPKLLTLVEGFINPVKPKMPGGADNARSTLPKQVLELNLRGVPPNVDPRRLSVRALLIGWDRATKERKVLAELSTRRFVPVSRPSPPPHMGMPPMSHGMPPGMPSPMMGPFGGGGGGGRGGGGGYGMMGMPPPPPPAGVGTPGGPGGPGGGGPGGAPPVFVVVFDDLIIRFSSAYHGIRGRLFLQFMLVDEQKNVVDSVESQGFQTITKRGLEKQRERMRQRQERSRMRQRQSVVAVQPSVGLTNGALLVRIRGEGFLASPLVPSIVTFGDRRAREIVSIRRDVIVCETPQHDPGLVSVNVSLDGRSFIPNSQAKFLYVAPHDQNGLRTLMTCLMSPNQLINFGPPRQQRGSAPAPGDDVDPLDDDAEMDVYTSSAQYEYRNFVTGSIVDSRGFSILHHSAARGYFELLSVLLGVHGDQIEVNQKDNFGRTPMCWAILSARPALTCCLLMAAGGRLDLEDVYGDTPLHLVAQEATDPVLLKKILFFYLKEDDEYQSRTRTLRRLLETENSQGMTPIQLCEEEEIGGLLRQFQSFCQQRLRTFCGESIQVRSGNHNGTVIDKILRQPMEIEFFSDRMEVIVDSSTRVVVPNNDLGFIILAKPEERIEFTLHRVPKILLKNGDDWEETTEEHLMKCLSFHFHSEMTELRRLHRHFTATFGEMMYEFKPWSFVYRSPRMEEAKRKKRMSTKPRRTHTHILERKLREFKQSNMSLLQEVRNRRLKTSRPETMPKNLLQSRPDIPV